MNTKLKSLAVAAAAGVAFGLISSPASAAVGTVTSVDAVADSTVSHVTFTQPSDAATVSYTYAYKLYPNGNPSGAQPAVDITATPDAVTGVVSFDIDTVCTAFSGSPLTCTATTSLVADGNQYRIQIGSYDGTTWTWTSTTGTVKVYATGEPAKPTITGTSGDAKLMVTGVTWATPGLDPSNTIYPFTGYEYTTDGGDTYASLTWDGMTASLPLTITDASAGGAIMNDTLYHLAIRAKNAKGKGPWSNILELTAHEVPSTPVVTAAAGTLGGTVVLTLTTPSTSASYSIGGYQYAVAPACSTWMDVTFTSGTATITVAGGSSVSVCVRAYDTATPVGYSEASAATTSVTTLTLCSTVVKPTLVYSLTSKNLTPAGRRVLNRFAEGLMASDCTHVSFNTVVRYAPNSVAFSRAQRRLAASRNSIVTAYLVGRGVDADMLHSSYTTTRRLVGANRTTFTATH